MSEPKLISPLLDGFVIGEAISEHHGVRSYPAIREKTDERYIVKIISIPAAQSQLDALLLSGAYADQAQALVYYKDLSDEVIQEVDILNRLSKLEGFIPYCDHQVVQKEDGTGYDVYLLSPYKRSLERQLHSNPPTHLGAVNLGLDLCAALAVCRRAGYLYCDLRCENVYLTEHQGYRIGDLGFIPLKSLKYASLPEKYRSSYTAPEISDAMASLNDTIDIYALGLVLYQVFNNGQLPFEGAAPSEVLQPPLYADYEMAEIILKACAPNPADRWQDPAQMGQALVNYMQRNSVNDTPVIPAPVEIPEVEPEDPTEEFLSEEENAEAMAELLEAMPEEVPPVEPAPEENTSEEAEPSDVDTPEAQAEEQSEEAAQSNEDEDLSFIDEATADETQPTEESAEGLEDTELTEEVAEILAQADDLIDHELPEPVVAPEPIDIPIPPPIVPEPEQVESESSEEELTSDIFEEISSDDDTNPEEFIEVGNDFEPADSPEEPQRKVPRIVVGICVVVALLAALAFGAIFFYNEYYLQPIHGISIEGTANEMTVTLVSDIDESLLTVTFTDTYGNTGSAPVQSGKAVFSNLIPSTQYRITVEISGIHKLIGVTADSYTTAAQTEILNFTATSGPEDGSVILSFSVNGPDAESWSVQYTADNSKEQTMDFSGHTVTITGLTVGTDYTFTLIPKTEMYLTGEHQLTFTPQKIIYAQNLTIDSCGGGSLSAVWTAPEGVGEQVWTVRCYNDAGYDETITTTTTSAVFDGLDHSTGYTVKVTAEGMTQSVTATVTADPITVNRYSVDPSDSEKLVLNWEFSGTAPEQGWELRYTIDGAPAQTLTCTEPTAEVPLYPGSKYSFIAKPLGDISYFSEPFAYEVPKPEDFEGYLVTPADMDFRMCVRPADEYWDRHTLADADYKTVFNADELAAFLIRMTKQYNTAEDMIVTTFVVRNSAGHPLSLDTQSRTWGDMWDGGYCQLEVPQLPGFAGEFTIEIYFNGFYVTTQSFSMELTPP